MAVPLRLSSYVDAHRGRIVDTLLEWLRIPSISADPAHAGDVRHSATFTADLLRDAGFEHVRELTAGGAPAVYGDWLRAGADAPTVVVYGHHDVQPIDPLDEWESPPFEPVIRDGECLGRGAIDDKGQVLYEIEAARGLLQVDGRLPVNLKLLVEGEEESGSPTFERILIDQRDLLACDAVVVSDTGMWAADVPSICTGMRGLAGFDVRLRTAAVDLHSGSFGGAVPNAAHLAARLVDSLHDDRGRVTVPGFYDDVRPLTDEERASFDSLPFDERSWRATAGVPFLTGEAGRTTLERVWSRPTCEVVGLSSGYAGAGIKTIVPATADVKVTFRLVADQEPEKVALAFERWVADQVPSGVEVTVVREGAVAPALTPTAHPAVGALGRVIERVWGRPPLFTREGGSGPEEALGRVLHAPVLYLGVGLPGDRIHAPNERMVMDQFWKGLLAAGELWPELAAVESWPR